MPDLHFVSDKDGPKILEERITFWKLINFIEMNYLNGQQRYPGGGLGVLHNSDTDRFCCCVLESI